MRALDHLRALILFPLLAIPFLMILAVTGAVPLLSLVIIRDFGGEPWKVPTEIWSSVGEQDEPFVRVYGPEWRAGTPIELEQIPDHVSGAFLAAEDVRFRSHFGIDLLGVARAVISNVRAGGIRQGGSTISQQVVKARYLSAERTWRRKFLEAVWALALELKLSKDEILEVYLNDVYLGHSGGRAVLGLDEASRVYYRKKAEDLEPAEVALIAAIVRAPNRDTPEKRRELTEKRRNAVLRTMHEEGWITDSQLEKALKTRVAFRRGSFPDGDYPAAVAAIRREAVRTIGRRRVERGGLKIWTEIDPRYQRQAERAVSEGRASLARRHSWIRKTNSKQPLQAAMLSIDARTGGIRAVVNGANPRDSFERTSEMYRQPGSAFKTFVYLAAIARRQVTPASLVLDEPLEIELDSGQTWEPRNYDSRFRGRVSVREAFESSLNVPAVRVMDDVGTSSVIRLARRSGFEEDFPPVPSLPLGVIEVTVRELTAAYTIFPGLGQRVDPFLLTRIDDRDGDTLWRHRAEEPIRVVDPASAYVTHSLLRGVVRRGTASRLSRYGLSSVAGKTGTTNDYRDAWFVGYSPDLVTTVWVGFDDGTPLRLSSSEAALPLWGTYMSRIPIEKKELPEPSGITWRKIDPETGLLWRRGCEGPRTEVFVAGTQPTRHCPTGWVGRVFRKIFEQQGYEEPPAITLEEVRELADELDRSRRSFEGALERVRRGLRRIFGDE